MVQKRKKKKKASFFSWPSVSVTALPIRPPEALSGPCTPRLPRIPSPPWGEGETWQVSSGGKPDAEERPRPLPTRNLASGASARPGYSMEPQSPLPLLGAHGHPSTSTPPIVSSRPPGGALAPGQPRPCPLKLTGQRGDRMKAVRAVLSKGKAMAPQRGVQKASWRRWLLS